MLFASLPAELLRDIVSNIASQVDICNLAACSRQSNEVTTPYLYQNIIIHEVIKPDVFDDENGPLRKIACLLLTRSDLANHVRSLTLHYVQLRHEQIMPDQSGILEDAVEPEDDEVEAFIEPRGFDRFEVVPFDDDYMDWIGSRADDSLKTAFRALGLSPDEERKCRFRLRGLSGFYHSLRLGLLLTALLKLEKLVLDLESGFDSYYLEKIIKILSQRETPVGTQSPLKALKVFINTQSGSNASNARNTVFIASLLKLQHIHEISGVFRDPWYENHSAPLMRDQSLAEIASSSSTVRHINMASFAVMAEDLNHIFRAPKALKTLTFTMCENREMSLHALRRALGPQESHLESLTVGYDLGWERYQGMNTWFVEQMTPFLSFKSLKVLKIAIRYFARTRTLIGIFPKSLETLHLTLFQACSERTLRLIERLLTRKSSEQIPSLKRILLEETSLEACLAGFKIMRPWDPQTYITQEIALSRLSTLAADHGVSIEAC